MNWNLSSKFQRDSQSNSKTPQRQGRFQPNERNNENKWNSSAVENATSGGWDNENENQDAGGGWENDNEGGGGGWDDIETSPICRPNQSNSNQRNETTGNNYRNVPPPQVFFFSII